MAPWQSSFTWVPSQQDLAPHRPVLANNAHHQCGQLFITSVMAFMFLLLPAAAGPVSGTIPARGSTKAGSVPPLSSHLDWRLQRSGRPMTAYPSFSMGWDKTRPGRSAVGARTKQCEQRASTASRMAWGRTGGRYLHEELLRCRLGAACQVVKDS